MSDTYWCERAWLEPGRLVTGAVVEVTGTRITAVGQADKPPHAAVRLDGLTVPGFANCHSHAFHRALRGHTQTERGTFWTWREQMYAVAERLDPDSYYALAHATYLEMAHAGISAVGEFHYLHHDPSGRPYADPNAMGQAVIAAARDAGLRITLLDTCYLSSGFGKPTEGVQRRFDDGTAQGWAERVDELGTSPDPGVLVAAAVHSVRAVPRDQLATVAAARPDAPLHIHLSEQVAENDACLAVHGCTPTQLLADAGLLGSRLSAVHATHLTEGDIALLGEASAHACFCPTTERDLADGIGPARLLHDAGSTVTLGSDSHAVIDPLEELRALELNERLATHQRGHWRAEELLIAGTAAGQRSLGFGDAGRIAPGQWADLVTLDTGSVRTAGTGGGAETAVFAATAADVGHVVASGRPNTTTRETVVRLLRQAIDDVGAGR